MFFKSRSAVYTLVLFIFISILTGAYTRTFAQDIPINPILLTDIWQAQWINHPEVPEDELGVFHFRKEFELDSAPDRFIIHVSADNRYKLFINGQEIGNGPARGDLKNWRFETYDVAEYLNAGTNVVGGMVWNYAEYRPVAQFTAGTGFVLQGDSDVEAILNTDSSWKVYRDEGFSIIPKNQWDMPSAYIVVGPGEKHDGATYTWGWTDVGYDDSSWPNAREAEAASPAGTDPHGHPDKRLLVPRNIPMMEFSRMEIPSVDRATGIAASDDFLRGTGTLTIPPNSEVTLLLDQEELVMAYPVMEISGGEGGTITMTYAEALYDEAGRKGNRNVIEGKTIQGYYDEILPDGGKNRVYSSLWLRTYRYLQLDITTGSEPLQIHEMYTLYTAYPFEEKASFSGDDDSLEDIWNVGWRTARLCALETYFDCPYYEQLQYVGDTRIQALISLYVSGDDRLVRNSIEAFEHSRLPSGLTESRYPSYEEQIIPPYSLMWIAMIYDYWMHRDDQPYVEQYLTSIRGVVEYYAQYIDDTGILGAMPWWNFVDWSFPRGVPPGGDDGFSSIITLQYIYVLQYAIDMADNFDRRSDVEYYQGLLDHLTEGVMQTCWDESRQLFADTPNKESFSQHANVMAVLTNLIPEHEQFELMERVLSEEDLVQCTYYYRFYLHQAMKKVGMGDRYLAALEPWRDMLDLGLTTFAEEPDPTRSDCHAWSASPNYDLLATVCGIRPASPGFKSVQISPALGDLKWIEGSIPHPAGEIIVELKQRRRDGIQGTVTLPDGLTGVFEYGGETLQLTPGKNSIKM